MVGFDSLHVRRQTAALPPHFDRVSAAAQPRHHRQTAAVTQRIGRTPAAHRQRTPQRPTAAVLGRNRGALAMDFVVIEDVGAITQT